MNANGDEFCGAEKGARVTVGLIQMMNNLATLDSLD